MPDHNNAHDEPNGFGKLPIQPTGSGVQDLEIAYEQMKLSADDSDATIPTQESDDAADSAAHPS